MVENAGEPSQAVTFRHEFSPGDVGRLIELHGLLYSREFGFDHTFEAYVAKPPTEFILTNTPRERIWLVDSDSVLMGSIAIVKHTAKLNSGLLKSTRGNSGVAG